MPRYITKRVKIDGRYYTQVYRFIGSYQWSQKPAVRNERRKRMLLKRRPIAIKELEKEQAEAGAKIYRSMAVWEVDTRDRGRVLKAVYRVRIYTEGEFMTPVELRRKIQEVFSLYEMEAPTNELAFEVNREIDRDEMEPKNAIIGKWYKFIRVEKDGHVYKDMDEVER